MKIDKARNVSESARQEMTAEALAVAFDMGTHMGRRAVIDAIAVTLGTLGDPLEKVWLEDITGKRRTLKVPEAQAFLGDRTNFRYIWAMPESERRNSKSMWLTAVTIDNLAVNGAILFFALPRGRAPEFEPHLTLLRSLAQAGIVPHYGFGYARQYGSPDYFALSYVRDNAIGAIDRTGWARPSTSSNNRARKPVERRYGEARVPILDIFPVNVLSEVHLRQKLAGESFREWIVRNTGPESLVPLASQCCAWVVPTPLTGWVSEQLQEFGMTLRDPPVRYQPRVARDLRPDC